MPFTLRNAAAKHKKDMTCRSPSKSFPPAIWGVLVQFSSVAGGPCPNCGLSMSWERVRTLFIDVDDEGEGDVRVGVLNQ